ncbi:ATP-binding protein [Streptomyces sp. J2-1]|uniref:ATP-binding protein n=1 Tax=Streptomyces corallincola TaxID=2851888 RepID=UPI001C38E621|nr:ATP-binding protein [Streptomyces corallincola]MBV2354002.1 ATP-binding protein [Streptomyces corallincola]
MTTEEEPRADTGRRVTPAEARDEVRTLLTAHFDSRREGAGGTGARVDTGADADVDTEGVADTVITDALLVTTELITNADRHGGGLTGFRATAHDGALHLAVSDRSLEAPELRPNDLSTLGGFGWPLVHRLCDKVCVEPRDDGKTITVTILLG